MPKENKRFPLFQAVQFWNEVSVRLQSVLDKSVSIDLAAARIKDDLVGLKAADGIEEIIITQIDHEEEEGDEDENKYFFKF